MILGWGSFHLSLFTWSHTQREMWAAFERCGSVCPFSSRWFTFASFLRTNCSVHSKEDQHFTPDWQQNKKTLNKSALQPTPRGVYRRQTLLFSIIIYSFDLVSMQFSKPSWQPQISIHCDTETSQCNCGSCEINSVDHVVCHRSIWVCTTETLTWRYCLFTAVCYAAQSRAPTRTLPEN